MSEPLLVLYIPLKGHNLNNNAVDIISKRQRKILCFEAQLSLGPVLEAQLSKAQLSKAQ